MVNLCYEKWCTLIITDLRESDSAEYKFKFTTNQPDEKYTGSPGVTLSVTGLQVEVSRYDSTWSELKCLSSCVLPRYPSYYWYKNGHYINTGSSYFVNFGSSDSYSCASSPAEQQEELCYASVSFSRNQEDLLYSNIRPARPHRRKEEEEDVEYTRVNIKSASAANDSIQSSDSGQYYCRAENQLGMKRSEFISIDVKYAPKLPSVSVSPSAEIVEGSSVTLTCSSDANPAANYIWYKEDVNPDPPPLSGEPQLVFSSIQSSDSGQYYCRAENLLGTNRSEFISIDVKYAPKLPSVSVSPSAEIVEGSSVTLTCSSDANPAANYTWYKEDVNPDPPPLSGEPQLVFSSIQSSDSGQYYCRAENLLGTNRSEFISIDVKFSPVSMTTVAVGSTTAIFLAIIILAAFLLIRRKRSSTQTSQSGYGPDNSAQSSPAEQQEELCYASVSFSRNQEDLLYSNIRPARPHRRKEEEEDVEYTRVNFKSASAANESRCQEAVGDLSALYSTVSKQPRA
ncbi:uncharacterized protein LOC142940066 [Anarhichas minor]|uniref:uncharacterized protein LOC142940066 n=1 Tax=Anarhichas minor TaxID=65739 RepID=UPI003F73A901